MLINVRIGGPRPPCARDAVDMLLECHERIRSHSTLAVRLARGEGDARMRSEAAAQLVRYFGTALPLHVEDEDLSMAPALREKGLTVLENEALAEMSQQHEDIDARLEELLPLWRAGESGALETSEQLARLFDGHLQLEEKMIFPAMRARLGPAEHQALIQAFRARREPNARPTHG
ncbi:MAG: hemerythrin domain-containing protein [Myxococcaceae bacterium]